MWTFLGLGAKRLPEQVVFVEVDIGDKAVCIKCLKNTRLMQ